MLADGIRLIVGYPGLTCKIPQSSPAAICGFQVSGFRTSDLTDYLKPVTLPQLNTRDFLTNPFNQIQPNGVPDSNLFLDKLG